MPLLILLIFAVVVGYWLSRSRYHTTIDKAAAAAVRQPKNWWNRIAHRSEGGGPIVEDSDQTKEN